MAQVPSYLLGVQFQGMLYPLNDMGEPDEESPGALIAFEVDPQWADSVYYQGRMPRDHMHHVHLINVCRRGGDGEVIPATDRYVHMHVPYFSETCTVWSWGRIWMNGVRPVSIDSDEVVRPSLKDVVTVDDLIQQQGDGKYVVQCATDEASMVFFTIQDLVGEVHRLDPRKIVRCPNNSIERLNSWVVTVHNGTVSVHADICFDVQGMSARGTIRKQGSSFEDALMQANFTWHQLW